ncbi:MAG: heme lyase CcmF/NrfE family subunit [Pseudomonadales bacterium]|nr:heme lyase CcmF/NrfE family subunit [Pseudomonadales bacterium]MCP5302847.1 heme lyase CcmF/NrfE family subunit [Pseudomonadales bacterium]
MLPELGQFSLILALCMAVLLAVIPLLGATRHNQLWMSYARPLVTGQFVFLIMSFTCLSVAFFMDDFSVAYVAQNSNSAMPVQYKLSAVWGAHEGSLLLWALILSGWTFAVAAFSRNLPDELIARVLSVMGMISIGFLLFLLLTSNPFTRLLPDSPLEGGDLNPLLQDVGLIFHPPLLYMGYVGFSVAFAFAIAALLGGQLDAAWARWSRPWTNIAWAFLTAGIVLGSYWAYYELGWGGWWFWDPVENASFMPWLVGCGLIHSLAVTDKRGVFKSWTVLLAIFAFSLSLLGTFLVRSGVLTSVHAFASDPARGLFILIFLFLVIGGSLTLYAIRAPAVVSKPVFGLWSREILLLLNNVILVVAAVTVLLGTLYPLIIDALGGGRISVGPPYFNLVFVPLMCVLFALLGFAPRSQWKRSSTLNLKRELLVAALASIGVGLLVPVIYGGEMHLGAVLAATLSLWIVITGGRDLLTKGRKLGFGRLSRSYMGMQLAHFGLAVCIIGVAFTSIYSEQRDVRMAPGDSVELGGYRFQFDGIQEVMGPNFKAEEGQITVYKADKQVYLLQPQKRVYLARRQSMTEAAIQTGFTRDLYVALGEPLGDGAWAVRVHYKAFVIWIWMGGLLMALGGFLAVTDRRYRIKMTQPEKSTNKGSLDASAGLEAKA